MIISYSFKYLFRTWISWEFIFYFIFLFISLIISSLDVFVSKEISIKLQWNPEISAHLMYLMNVFLSLHIFRESRAEIKHV